MEERTFKEKMEDFKVKTRWKAEEVKTWSRDNKEWLVVAGPVVLTSAVQLIKTAARRGTVNEEKKLKENYIYDRSAGHYYETKRKLRSSEWIMIDERRRNGEPLGEILRSMKVLK